jgi:hypothetical protein
MTGDSTAALFVTALGVVVVLRVGVVSTTNRLVAVVGVMLKGDSRTFGLQVAGAGGTSFDLDFFITCGSSISGERGALRFVLILAPGGV